MIKRIVIIGGGTSGWLTTLNFLNHTDNPQIINISSKEIPINGVGESTTGAIVDLLRSDRNIKINEIDFLKNTNSTFKYGVWHKDWHKKGESFISPLGDEFLNNSGHPSEDYDYYRIYHVAKNNMPYQQTQAQLIKHNKLAYLNVPDNDPYKCEFNTTSGDVDFSFHPPHNHTSYHIDSIKVGYYLKRQVLNNKRVKHYDDLVVKAEKDENGYVKKLLLKSGRVVEGDLFVDCTGFFRLLIGDDNEFIDWSNNLLTNRAISFPTKEYTITNHTTAQARKYGWEWNIPLQNRMGRGYVFNDNMLSVDKAIEEMREIHGEIEVVNDVSFKPGRMKNAWYKNVISTGLSTGFVEPLEATAIHMTIIQINIFLKSYYSDHMDLTKSCQHKNYNRTIGETWDDIRDFIVTHYINTRQDTDFWRESSSKDRWSERLTDLMEIWSTRMPRMEDYSTGNMKFYTLGNTLWYQVLIGMKILNPQVAKNELKSYKLYDDTARHLSERTKFNNHVVKLGYDTEEFYKKELHNLYDYKKVTL